MFWQWCLTSICKQLTCNETQSHIVRRVRQKFWIKGGRLKWMISNYPRHGYSGTHIRYTSCWFFNKGTPMYNFMRKMPCISLWAWQSSDALKRIWISTENFLKGINILPVLLVIPGIFIGFITEILFRVGQESSQCDLFEKVDYDDRNWCNKRNLEWHIDRNSLVMHPLMPTKWY